jgi:hypothetical protein
VTECTSTYLVSQVQLQEFLRNLFGDGEYKIAISNDQYFMSLTRALSEEERNEAPQKSPERE